MSLLNKASLIQIPSGYKDGTLYSAKPTNGDGDFTFSRGSNLAATRVNSEGLIEKGRENLLLQSNQFDTTWLLSGVTRTSGQSGYDGSNDAWQIDKTTSDGYIYQNLSASGVLNYSVYLKAGTVDWVRLQVNASTAYYQYINLTNGVLGLGGNISSKTTSVGNGWYRCEFAFTDSSVSRVRIYPAINDGDVSGTSGSIYIQDAQLELGLVATDYIETGASTAQAGILEDMPRLDYSGGATCPSLLLEPQRTNILENSEYILGGDWNQLGGALSIAQNTTDTLSPEGKYNAGKITLSNTANRYFASQGYNLGGLTNISLSVWLKSDGADIEGSLSFFNGAGGDAITITNEWKRFEINKTASNSSEYIGLDFRGAGHSTSGVVYCYGWQFENNVTYSTSYIPTYGSSVTRSQDEAYNNQSLVTDVNAFTMFVEGELTAIVDSQFISVHNNSNSVVWIQADSLGRIKAQVFYGGGFVDTIITSVSFASTNTRYKMAYRIENGNSVFFINGVEIGSSSTTIANPNGLAYVELGNFWTSQNTSSNTKINNALVFNSLLTNDELASLTTI